MKNMFHIASLSLSFSYNFFATTMTKFVVIFWPYNVTSVNAVTEWLQQTRWNNTNNTQTESKFNKKRTNGNKRARITQITHKPNPNLMNKKQQTATLTTTTTTKMTTLTATTTTTLTATTSLATTMTLTTTKLTTTLTKKQQQR